jgi:hypothetical protein
MSTGDYEKGVSAAMTITNASSSFTGSKSGRTLKFTHQAIEKIKELVAQGVSREEIAKLLDVTVGSLQVTCSRLGISLRRLGIHKAPTRAALIATVDVSSFSLARRNTTAGGREGTTVVRKVCDHGATKGRRGSS